MYKAIVYDTSTGRIVTRYNCSSEKQLNCQEIPAGCEMIKGDFSDPNKFKVLPSKAIVALADNEKVPIVR